MQSRAYTTGVVTSRLIRNVKARRVEFVPIGATAAATIGAIDGATELAFLVGNAPAGGWRPWALEAPAGWTLGDHYYEAATPVLRYQRPGGGRLEVQHADAWYMGERDYTPAEATAAWALLGEILPRRFPGAILWNTPATTGRDLWLRKIEPGKQWPTLEPDLAALVRDTAIGGRAELIDHAADEIPALYEYDGRIMYAALCSGLAGGAPRWEAEHAAARIFTTDPQARARYQITATVPADWPYPFGLLGIKATGNERGRYPHDPGETFTTWCEGSELHLAARMGWPFRIHEGLVWPRYAGKGPLDSWANAIIATRDSLTASVGRRYEVRAFVLARAALRSIVLHTIGSLHSSSHRVSRYAAGPDDLPAEARKNARPEPGGGYTYPVEMPAKWAQMQHPELSAAVWGKARVRLLAGPGRTGALHARGDVLAFRTDAIYTTAEQEWPDDGRAGRFRLKRHGIGPFPTPRSARELLALRGSLPL